jgi:hypothetical protein
VCKAISLRDAQAERLLHSRASKIWEKGRRRNYGGYNDQLLYELFKRQEKEKEGT